MPSAPTHLCWFYVRFVRGILSCAPLCHGRLRSSCRLSMPTPGLLLLRNPQGTVILAFPIWVACQLSIRDRLNSRSLPCFHVDFDSLSYPIRFSLSIGTFGFSAGWILLCPPFSLLISTFSLLIAWSDSPCGVDSNSYRVPFPLYRTFYYRSFQRSFSLPLSRTHRFGF